MLPMIVEELFVPVAPVTGMVYVYPVTSTSFHHDLTAANSAALRAAINGGCIVEITCDDDVFWRWSIATSGETVDQAITIAAGTQANMAPRLFAGERKVERPGLINANQEVNGLVVKSVVAATFFRVTICSRSAAQRMALNG